MREVNNDKSDNFEMEILGGGVLDQALTGTEKNIQKTSKTIYDVVDNEYFKQSDVEFTQ